MPGVHESGYEFINEMLLIVVIEANVSVEIIITLKNLHKNCVESELYKSMYEVHKG